MFYSENVFVVLAKKLVHGFGGEDHNVSSTFRRRFGEHFGTTMENLPLLWHHCVDDEESTIDRSK